MIINLKAIRQILNGRPIFVFRYNLMLTLTTNVEVFKEYQPRSSSVKTKINVYSIIKRQRFINYQQRS